MTCTFYVDFLSPHQFTTESWSPRSKKRDKEFELVKERGQERRIVVSPYGEVLASDIPLYEALIMACYDAIAVVVVVGCAEPADIKAAKAFSAKHPLRHVGYGRVEAFREYAEYVNGTRNP
jgi:hypothetical protein